MKRTTVFLEEAIERDLKTIASRKGAPLASVVREALARYVSDESTAGATLPTFVGIGASGHTDTAERHDELLFVNLEAGLRRTPVRPASARTKPARRRR
jgi:hypothetical protein